MRKKGLEDLQSVVVHRDPRRDGMNRVVGGGDLGGESITRKTAEIKPRSILLAGKCGTVEIL